MLKLLLILIFLVPFVAEAHPDEFLENMTVEQTKTVDPMPSIFFGDNALTIFEEDEWLFCDDDDFEPGARLDECDDIEEIDFPFEPNDDDTCFFPPCIPEEFEATFFYLNEEAEFCTGCGICNNDPFVMFLLEDENSQGGLFGFMGFRPENSNGVTGRTLCSQGDIDCESVGYINVVLELFKTGGFKLYTQSRTETCTFSNYQRFPLFEESEARIVVSGPGWYHEPHRRACGLVGLELLLVPLLAFARRRR